MDLSKLPRMSKTPANPAPVPADSVPPQPTENKKPSDSESATPPAIGAEIWFMTIIGILLIIFGGGILRYAYSKVTHKPYHTDTIWTQGEKEGQEVEYPDLMDFSGLQGGKFYTDACLVLFGVTLIVDAVGRGLASSRLPGRRAILGLTLAVTVFMMAYNLHVAAKYMGAGSLPIVSGLAIAFGGYLVVFQFAMFKSLRPARH